MKRKKRERSALSIAKDALWRECKRIIRAKYGNTCYTCGKSGLEGAQWHTGHFIASSVCSVELRYALENLRPQCWRCNINLSGNWIAYEAHLIEDHGQGYVDALKERNRTTKGKQYTLRWYLDKIEEYKAL